MKSILGVDTGFRHIGFAVVKQDEFERNILQAYGFWDLASEYPSMNKRSVKGMRIMKDALHDLQDKATFDSLILETVPQVRFNGRDATLASTNFLRAYAIMFDLDYAEIMARKAKQVMTDDSKASKDAMKAAAIATYPGLEDDLRYDVYDAICIATTGAKMPDVWQYAI